MASVGRRELESLVERYSRHDRDPTRRVSAASIRRMVADLRPCWDRAVLEEVIPANPWRQVDLGLRARAGGKRASGTALAADADLVLDPAQVWSLADACVEHGSWGPVVRGFVLVMGFCGLRPNEAAGLLIGDLELDAGWLTVRRSHRRVPARFLDAEEDPDWGPLKGRELTDERRVPVPSEVAAALRRHLDDHRANAGPSDLVFERNGRPFNLSSFHVDVWSPGRATLFPLVDGLDVDSPLQPKLARLRRHDLRHSACSMWLRAGVDVTVCQKWSGHKRLSVFLDVYQGVMPGRETDGVRSLEALLASAARRPRR
jgi:integrase